MKLMQAFDILEQYDRQGLTVWSLSGLRMVLVERPTTFRKTLERLCSENVLSRISRGLYVFAHTSRDRRVVVGEIIAGLRAGEYCFESLESAANEWGIISQTPLGVTTVMTTGRSGTFNTPYGSVEFVHTDASVNEILRETLQREDFIPLATREYTLHGLKRCGRTSELREAFALSDLEE